jgi:Bacterial regulatory proteins, luxR family
MTATPSIELPAWMAEQLSQASPDLLGQMVQICHRLFISDATAKTHVARILQKLGLRDRVQVVIYAYESGLVSPAAIANTFCARNSRLLSTSPGLSPLQAST